MSDRYSMVAAHAKGKVAADVIFEAGRRAGEAIARDGAAAVVNATIGTLLTDEERLAWLPTVFRVLKELPPDAFAAYSPFQGAPDFRQAIEDMTLGAYRPEAFTATFATPGSTGALRNAFWNYLSAGEAALLPDWNWAAYSTIAAEHGRKVQPYKLFDKERRFSVQGLEEALRAKLAQDGRALVVLNDPGHNPTGYDMSPADWDAVLALVTDASRSGQIILVVDVPYLDYAAAGERARAFMARLGTLPRQVLTILCASISKSFTLYGMRTGAMIGISSDKGVIDEFGEVNAHSARGVWTNVPRAGMAVVTAIHKDAGLTAELERERADLRQLLRARADIFTREAVACGLPIMPYRSGFFISIPSDRPAKVAEALWDHNIFTVPMRMGVRFAISSVATHKVSGCAARIKDALSAS